MLVTRLLHIWLISCCHMLVSLHICPCLLHCMLHTLVHCTLACLVCIAFGMPCLLSFMIAYLTHVAYVRYIAYMHSISLGLGCQTKHESWGVFILKVMKHASTLGRQYPWPQHDRALVLICFVASIYIDWQTWPLRPSRIEMRNWWPEGRGPRSLESITY